MPPDDLGIGMKIFRSLLKIFRCESWNCYDRYGVFPEAFLTVALQLTSNGALFEVSPEDLGVLPIEYRRAKNHKSVISHQGESFLVSADFSARYCDDLRNFRVAVPDSYCLIESNQIVLTVVNRSEILDYSIPFLKLLETRLTRSNY